MITRKTLLGGALVVVLSVSTVGFRPDSRDVRNAHHQLMGTAISMDHVPPAFKQEKNLKAAEQRLGFIPGKSLAKLNMNVDFVPISNNKENYMNVTGQGVLHVDSGTFPFKVAKWSRVQQAVLRDGSTFIWGAVDGVVTTKKGENPIAIGLAYVPETGKSNMTATIGTIEEGHAALAFGDLLMTPEMNELQVGDAFR